MAGTTWLLAGLGSLSALGRVSRETETGHAGAPVLNAQNNPKPQTQELQATTTPCPLSRSNRSPDVRPTTTTTSQDMMEAPWQAGPWGLEQYGRAQAWLKRTMRDLEMERDVHGHQPSVIFADRA
jgi:hypothetical protein